MIRPEYDFAVVGSTPLAALISAELAGRHGRQVLRIKRTISPQRLIRRIDLALPLATRPQTWRMVQSSGLPVRRGEVAVLAETGASIAALDHVSHIAMGLGISGRRVAQAGGGFEYVFGGAGLLDPAAIPAETVLPAVEMGQVRLHPAKRSGAAELWLDDERLPAGQIVVADDFTILDWVPEDQMPPHLVVQPMTATLTAPTRPPAAPVMLFPDRGVTLLRQPGEAVLGIVAGDDAVEARLASTLRGPFPISRVATSRFRSLVPRDGAPVIGRLKPSRLFIVAGLGHVAAFFAPAIARHLAGAPEGDDKAWFAAHDPYSETRAQVAEYVP